MILIILSITISAVFSQSHHHDIATAVDQTFYLVDFDPKDGYLEIQELTAGFHYIDKNGDGVLSFDEYANVTSTDAIQHDIFNHYDSNNDGVLQKSEYVDTPFSLMDHNGDGLVTRHDYDHFYTDMIHHILQNNGHHGRK
uniref:Uncharacterized protein LOC111127062 n=1 Tax=Crassostrea virginica TaxID=6565 RepID=A0A8B8DJK4_CRAVI|nr:uncharacterized protein LOC111127062 [Crassostrea virginica]